MSNSEHERLLWVDELCDRFESAWGTEKQFTIEMVLRNIPSVKKEPALKALLALEQDFRANTDNPLSLSEMQKRFPSHQSIVDLVARNPNIKDSLRPQADTLGHIAGHPNDLRIPQQLGRYRIVRKLGQGAMGSVFLANDEQLRRKVALKVPRGDVQRDAELRVRFEREARAVAALDHPNICRVHDIGEFEGIHYICMGYIEGCSLERFAVAESGLGEQRIAELMLKLAKALGAAHEAGFIHRDLKPANVMIDTHDEPVILDFGLARKVAPNQDTRLTQTGGNVGSPAYMSPEQVDGDHEKIGVQTDVYSLGVLLYELLTGRLPFEGSMASVMGQIMTKEPDRPSEYRRDLSVRLEKICLRMMAKQTETRYLSMHAIAADLQEYLEKFTPGASEALVEKKPNEDSSTKRRQQIEGLIRSADYAKAEKLMVTLSRETDESLLEAAAWAASELPALRKTREEVRAGRKDIYNTASRLMKSHDYEQARRLLEEYPYDLRTPKMQELLERAETTTHKVERLRRRIREERSRGDNRALLASLSALMELKPGDRRAKELREQLTRRSDGLITKVLGEHTPSFIERMSSGIQAGLLASVCVAVSAYPAYWWATGFLSTEISEGRRPDIAGDPSEPTDDLNGAPAVESDAAVTVTSDSGTQLNAQPKEDDAEWTDLLAGDLSSTWEPYSGGALSADWKLSDGVLSLSRDVKSRRKGPDSIVTKTSYADFELEFEWKIAGNSDSGVLYLVEMGLKKSYVSGPEYQIIDNDAYLETASPKTVSGSIFGIAAVRNDHPRPIGQWNTGRITKNGRVLAHWLNGVKVAEIEMESAEWRQAISERTQMKNWTRFAKARSGRIALQDMGKNVSFRNFRIRSLNDTQLGADAL